MRIQNNISAMNTHRVMGINNTNMSKSLEKLSSGYRINRAGDDAAGLAISEKMRAQIRGLTMASKNSSDAISLVQTAEGALQSTHDILQRMRELAVQAASDTNEQTIDRGALNQEFQALKKEIDDIASKTRFNDQNLIDGTFEQYKSYMSTATFAVGSGVGNNMSILVDRATAGTYLVTVTAHTAVAAQTVAGVAASATIASSTALGAIATATVTTGGVNVMGSVAATLTPIQTADHNGNTYTFKVSGSEASNLTVQLLDTQGNVVSQIQNFNGVGGGTFTLNFDGVGAYTVAIGGSASIEDNVDGSAAWDNLLSGKTLVFSQVGKDPGVIPAVEGYVEVSIGGDTLQLHKGDTSAIFKSSGIQLSFNAISDFDFTGNGVKFSATGSIVVGQLTGQSMIIQSGANQGDELAINIDAMNTRKLGIAFSDISTQRSASKAITEVNDALNQVSTQRAALGALQNRLEFKISNLDTSAENLQSAESRIRDVDMAKEMMNFTKSNILSQAATAMMAQANSLPQNVLQLLR